MGIFECSSIYHHLYHQNYCLPVKYTWHIDNRIYQRLWSSPAFIYKNSSNVVRRVRCSLGQGKRKPLICWLAINKKISLKKNLFNALMTTVYLEALHEGQRWVLYLSWVRDDIDLCLFGRVYGLLVGGGCKAVWQRQYWHFIREPMNCSTIQSGCSRWHE